MFLNLMLMFSFFLATSCQKKVKTSDAGEKSSESKVNQSTPGPVESSSEVIDIAPSGTDTSAGSATTSNAASVAISSPLSNTDLSYAKVMAVRILPGEGCNASASTADSSVRKEQCWADLRLGEKNNRYYFNVAASAGEDALGFSQQCAGMDFPRNTWQSGCELNFTGPRITDAQRSVALPIKGQSLVCNSDGCPGPIKLMEFDFLKGDLDRCFLPTKACFADLEVKGVKKRFYFSKDAYINGNEDVLRISQGCDIRHIVRLPMFADCSFAFQGPTIVELCGSKWTDALACNQTGCHCRSIDLGPNLLQ